MSKGINEHVGNLNGVREYTKGKPIELHMNAEGRMVIRAYTGLWNAYTDMDYLDLIAWLQSKMPLGAP